MRPAAPLRTTESPLEMPTLSRLATMLGRTLRLRCPNCGEGPVLDGWAKTQESCTGCGMRFHRGDHDYFSGAQFCNLMVSEAIFAIGFVGVFLATWPDVPWDAITWGAPLAMVVFPLLLYPVSKVLWLGVDVLVRPVTAEELAPATPAATIPTAA